MKKFKKILACVDFSEYTQMTMEYVVKLAKDNNSEIIVYHVINENEFKFYELASIYLVEAVTIEEFNKNLRKERYAALKKLITSNFFDYKYLMTLKIDQGVPFECILKAIDSEGVDLVVMANKGKGNVSGILFGSAAEKVFRHSPVPVLSVRDRAKFRRKEFF